jgi:hypothetical protein
MDSYVVRIYRRNPGNHKEVGGLIERIGNDKRQAFSNCEELWAFLTGDCPRKPQRGRMGPAKVK